MGDAPARFCECFERRLTAMGAEDAPANQTFDAFDAGFIPEEGGQRARMLEARAALEDFADRFPDAHRRGVVLMGAGGLGKSFLLNCVYERVLRREAGCAAHNGVSHVRGDAQAPHQRARGGTTPSASCCARRFCS